MSASVVVKLPPVLRLAVGGARQLDAHGACIAEVVADVARPYPSLALHFYDERGAIRRNIVFIHGDDVVRPPEAGEWAVSEGDELAITNALAGG